MSHKNVAYAQSAINQEVKRAKANVRQACRGVGTVVFHEWEISLKDSYPMPTCFTLHIPYTTTSHDGNCISHETYNVAL